MGDSCSKMDGREEPKKPPAFEAKPTVARDMPPPPPPQEHEEDDSDHDNYEATNNSYRHTRQAAATMNRNDDHNHVAPKRLRRSIFRIGSRRTPASPARASNYNHVHDAVSINFQEAASERSRQTAVPLGVVGLRNLGNTCFLNSSVQCLSATIPLTDYFLGYNYRSEINKKNPLGTGGKLVVAYAELMKVMWLGKNTVIKPTSFKAQLEKFAPQFVGNHQHDSQELLAFLLDGIHEDLNRIKKKPYIEDPDFDGSHDERDAIEAWKNYLRRDKSLIVDIFQGQLRTALECLRCGHKNIRFEPFMYLSLPISDSCQTLDDCLDLYLQEEKLVGDNQWYCTKCKRHRNATKKTDLWILPPILIVHLKRFKFNDYGHIGSKNNAPMGYPINNWDLTKFVLSQGSEEPKYDLYAVSNHVGGLGSGHYTAYGKNRFDDSWYEFNDSSCRRISERTLRSNSSSAYLLFYNRAVGEMQRGHLAGRVPLIRRQSVSRPDLWPHTQVQNSQFREFTRQSVKSLRIPEPPLTSQDSSIREANDTDESADLKRDDREVSL